MGQEKHTPFLVMEGEAGNSCWHEQSEDPSRRLFHRHIDFLILIRLVLIVTLRVEIPMCIDIDHELGARLRESASSQAI